MRLSHGSSAMQYHNARTCFFSVSNDIKLLVSVADCGRALCSICLVSQLPMRPVQTFHSVLKDGISDGNASWTIRWGSVGLWNQVTNTMPDVNREHSAIFFNRRYRLQMVIAALQKWWVLRDGIEHHVHLQADGLSQPGRKRCRTAKLFRHICGHIWTL